MKTSTFTTSVFLGLLAGGCHVGPQIHELDEATQPTGAVIEMQVFREGGSKGPRYGGELLEVSDDGMLVAVQGADGTRTRLTSVPWSSVRSVGATGLPGFRYTVSSRGAFSTKAVDNLRLVSRFPQGLSEDLLSTLLASFNQSTVDSLPQD